MLNYSNTDPKGYRQTRRMSIGFTVALLCLSLFAGAQNPVVNIANTGTASIEYLPTTNQYLLSGSAVPTTVSGMSNVYGSLVLPRPLLSVMNDNLTSAKYSTFCTQSEVNDVLNGTCPALSVFFHTNDARQTADGGFIICGDVFRDFESTNCAGSTYHNPFLLRLDRRGTPIWYKRYQINYASGGTFNSVIEDSATGNILVCGKSDYIEAFVMATSANGNPLWSYFVNGKLYGTDSAIMSEYTKIAPYKDPNNPTKQYYVLTGTVGGAFTVGSMVNYGGGLLTMLDAPGTVYTNVELTEDPYLRFLHLYGITDAYDGDVALCGFSGGRSCGAHDGWNLAIMKINPLTLSQSFMKVYQDDITNQFSVSRGLSIIHQNAAGGDIFVTGYENSGVVWSSDFAMFAQVDNGGNIIRYLPHSSSYTTAGVGINYNTDYGFPVYCGGGAPTGSVLAKDNYGSNHDCDDDITADVTDLSSDPINNYIWPVPVGVVAENVLAYDIKPTLTHICGNSSKQEPTSIVLASKEISVSISPNPAVDHLNLQLSRACLGVANIYDIQGRLVLTRELDPTSETTRINIEKLSAGIYTIKVGLDDTIVRDMFVKH